MVEMSHGPGTVSVMDRKQAAQILGIPEDAQAGAIRTAYRRRSLQVHPDAGGDAAAFHNLTSAYETMTAVRAASAPKPRQPRHAPATAAAPAPDEDLTSFVARHKVRRSGRIARRALNAAVAAARAVGPNWATFVALLYCTFRGWDTASTWGLAAYLLEPLHPAALTSTLSITTAVLGLLAVVVLVAKAQRTGTAKAVLALSIGLTWLGFWFGWWPGLIPLGLVTTITLLVLWVKATNAAARQ